MKIKTFSKKIVSKMAILCLVLIVVFPQVASAAAITSVKDILSTNKVSTDANHTFTFTTPTGVEASTDTITVTFPAGWTMGSVAFGDMDLADDGVDKTLAASAAVGTWGAAVAGQVVTFTPPTNAAVGEIAAGSVITIEIGTNAGGGSNKITNSASTGSHIISVGGNFGDSGSMAVALVTDPQVDVTADVNESLTLALSATSVAFGTLSASSESSGSMTLTVNTNAANGYNLAYEATNLLHTNASDSIAALAGAVSAAGTEGWGINLKDNVTPNVGADATSTAGDGTPTPAADYNVADQLKIVTGSVNTGLASAAGTAQDDVYTVSYVANISAITEAGDYSATVDYIAYATF